MKIINQETPTSDLTAIKIGDQISNGLGTFGEVEAIDFEDTATEWSFVFKLVGGGFIASKITKKFC